MRLLPFPLLALLALGCGESAETASERCQRVRERLVQLELPLTDPRRDAHAKTMRSAMGNQFLKRCESSLSAAQQACVLDATNARVAFGCLSKEISSKESR